MICPSTQELGRGALKPLSSVSLNYFHSTSLAPWYSMTPPASRLKLKTSKIWQQLIFLLFYTPLSTSKEDLLKYSHLLMILQLFYYLPLLCISVSQKCPLSINTQFQGCLFPWKHTVHLLPIFTPLNSFSTEISQLFVYFLMTFKILPYKLVYCFLLYLIQFFKGKSSPCQSKSSLTKQSTLPMVGIA